MLKTKIARLLALFRWPVWYELQVRKDLDLTDIRAELQRKALREAAEFVAENLRGVDSFDNKHEILKSALKEANPDQGLNLEFGVYKGGTINYMASLTGSYIYGFDSFEGLPDRWGDNAGIGMFKVSALPKVRPNVTLIKGWFEDTLPKFIKEKASVGFVSFMHIDCDIYSSTKTIFSLLAPYIRSGTVIAFDEFFNYDGWKDGEYKAFMEFIAETGHRYEYLSYNRVGQQVSLKIIS